MRPHLVRWVPCICDFFFVLCESVKAHTRAIEYRPFPSGDIYLHFGENIEPKYYCYEIVYYKLFIHSIAMETLKYDFEASR